MRGTNSTFSRLGWLLAEEGVWTPYGNPTTGAGVTPGGASSIVVGLPLMVWKHHRAPALLIWLSHLLAYWMLDRWLKRILVPEERFLFALLYWLNPWRIYHSVFLWNPNYLFFFGAVHLSTSYEMRDWPRPWMTFWHVLSIGIVLQLEVVALPLAVASMFFWWKGYIQIHWGGALAACVAVAMSLLPWALAVAENPGLMIRQEGFLGFGLLMVYPVYRGAMYWVRYSTLGLSEELFCLDYAYLIGGAWMDRLRPFLQFAKTAVYALTVPLSVWAFYKFWQGSGQVVARQLLGRFRPRMAGRCGALGLCRRDSGLLHRSIEHHALACTGGFSAGDPATGLGLWAAAREHGECVGFARTPSLCGSNPGGDSGSSSRRSDDSLWW